MSVAQPPAEIISGFHYTCRLAPDGTLAFDAPVVEIERLVEVTPVEVAAMLAAGHFPIVPDAGPELLASVRESVERLTPWVRDLRVVTPRTAREVWLRIHGLPRRESGGAVVWTGLI